LDVGRSPSDHSLVGDVFAQLKENPLEQVIQPAKHAASWPAIIAGAFVAVSITLVLVALGSGIGFASISPWPGRGMSVTSFAITTAIWLIVTQWIAAALGGYIAGRLRTRWIGTHTHEIFFRDTAHGLITWAVATVVILSVAAGSAASGAGAGLHAAADAASMGGQAMASQAANAYSVDKLFRSSGSTAGGSAGGSTAGVSSDPRLETAHIVANAATTGSVPDADRAYLAQQVAARTGISQQEAQARVDAFVSSVTQAQEKVKADADAARKAAAQASIYLALSMLIGAFIASVSAALGGRLRDEHP
jgi:hypothetical protein